MIEWTILFFLVSLLMLAVLLALAVIVPSWHWVAGSIGAVGCGGALSWIGLIATRPRDYGIAFAFLSLVSWSFLAAAITYFIGLVWWYSKK
jgi:lipoprotein signal peptidase